MDERTTLTPIYDAVNTQLYDDPHRLCLELLKGNDLPEKQSVYGLESRDDFLELADKLSVPRKGIEVYIDKTIMKNIEPITNLIMKSALTEDLKSAYIKVIKTHAQLLAQ